MDKRIKFYSHNTNLLPPKPKSSFRHLKKCIQEFLRKCVFVLAGKATNNIVVVCRLHYINTLKQELNGINAYEVTSTDEKTVVSSHLNELYKARFIANSSSCTTTELFKLLTSCLTAVNSRAIRYYGTVYERSRKKCLISKKFW